MDTLVRHIWNIKDPKEYTKYESTVIRLLNELDKDCTRHDNRFKFRSVQKQFLKSLDKNKTILLYLKDDEVVGLTLMIVSEGLVSTLSLSDLIVDSKYRNKGYGSYILEDSINYAKERKFKNVCLQVFTNNTVARNMYLKRGFKPVTEFMMLGLESMNTINKDTYILEIGNEFFGLFNSYTKEEAINVYKQVSKELDKLIKRYNLQKFYKNEKLDEDRFNKFPNSKLENRWESVLNVGWLFIFETNFTLKVKEDLIKFLREASTKIPKKYSYVCTVSSKSNYLSIRIGFSKEGYKFDLNKFIESLNLTKLPDNEIAFRKNLVKKITAIIKQLLSSPKYKKIEKGFILSGRDDVEDFVVGDENEYRITWDIWRVTNRARDDEVYEEIMEIFYAYVKDLETQVKKLNCSLDWDGDWDDAYITITPNKKANESLYLKSLSQYKYLVTYDFNEVGLESFGSEILRIITGILDTVLKLLNNFKATVLGTFKDLKRTELQEYEDSNKITLQRVLRYPYEFLANQNVVVPRGMVKPYKVTTEKIKGCLDVLDMVNRSEKALASVNNVLNMLMSNTKLQVKQDTINVGELRSLEHIFKEENNCFSVFKRCEELPFSKVFVSDHCLKDTYDLLSNTVIYEQDVSRVYNILNTIYQKFEQILRLVESNQVNITKSDLIMLAGQTTTLAKLFDLYGTVITDLQRVEHNFVLVLSSIAEKHGL